MASEADIRREEADAREDAAGGQAKRVIKSEQDRLAFGKPTAELEWDGIRKLDMPPPRWWVLTFWACFLFAVVWWVLYPSWPGTRSYFPGLLGYDQRAVVAEQIAAAEERRAAAAARDRCGSSSSSRSRPTPGCCSTPSLRAAWRSPTTARPATGWVAPGRASFRASPTTTGSGAARWPTSSTPSPMASAMAARRRAIRRCRAFGADQILTRDQVLDVSEYVLSLTGRAGDRRGRRPSGEAVFAENCVACHGEGGIGMQELGAPALNDAIWLYGGDEGEHRAPDPSSPPRRDAGLRQPPR